MKPSTPKTELKPSTQLQKVVFGGSLIVVLAACTTFTIGCASSSKPVGTKSPAQDIHASAAMGNLNAIRYWLTTNAALVNAQEKHSGFTPLHRAACPGSEGYWRPLVDYVPIVAYLIKSGADVNAKATNGITPLHMASQWHLPEGASISELGSGGVEVAITTDKGDMHTTARFRIPESPVKSQLSIMVMLVDRGADVNAHAEGKGTPLHSAILTGTKEAVEFLLKNGGNRSATIERSGRTLSARELAVAVGRSDLSDLLRE